MNTEIFQGCRIFIIPTGLMMKRIKLFEEQILKHKGEILTHESKALPTQIVIEENYLLDSRRLENALKAVGLSLIDVKCDIVGTIWLSRCIKEKKLLNTEEFKFNVRKSESNNHDSSERPIKIQRLENSSQLLEDSGIECDSGNEKNTMNGRIIEEFKKLAEAYRATGDQWRTVGYDKALASLKLYNKPIHDAKELRLLPHVSNKMIDKISEIIEFGSCAKVEEICNNEKTKVLELFNKVWGVGPNTAQLWYQKGLRTLEDLYLKGNLTVQQKLGLKYFQEIEEKIPRQEVEEIIEIVKTAIRLVDDSLEVIPCGSYRRGKLSCGDVDIVVIAEKTHTVLQKILSKLRNQDFLVDDLSVGKENSCTKYLGLCKLPKENGKVRRLDIFVVTKRNSACAILHYTGSSFFNRGIRCHARKMNMKLNEYNLFLNREIVTTPTEESIFEHLKLAYVPPSERATF